MIVWVMFVLIQNTHERRSAMAAYQQEFKTKEECQKGATILKSTIYQDAWASRFSSVCMEVRK